MTEPTWKGAELSTGLPQSHWEEIATYIKADDELADRKLYPIAWAIPDFDPYGDGQPGDELVVVKCPYCGEQHRHGSVGTRVAHCDLADDKFPDWAVQAEALYSYQYLVALPLGVTILSGGEIA